MPRLTVQDGGDRSCRTGRAGTAALPAREMRLKFEHLIEVNDLAANPLLTPLTREERSSACAAAPRTRLPARPGACRIVERGEAGLSAICTSATPW